MTIDELLNVLYQEDNWIASKVHDEIVLSIEKDYDMSLTIEVLVRWLTGFLVISNAWPGDEAWEDHVNATDILEYIERTVFDG